MKRKKSARIKTIWFDLGNVVLFFDFKPAFRSLSRFTHRGADEIARYFREHPTLEARVDEGKVSARKLYDSIRKDLQVRGLDFGEFCRIWNDIFMPNRPVIRLVKQLKEGGFQLILISNTNRLHWDYLVRTYPFLRRFDKHVLSFRVGARKPKRRIYREALRISRARPDEILYIDDRDDLTSTAFLNHGIHIHTYRSLQGLGRALTRMGLPSLR